MLFTLNQAILTVPHDPLLPHVERQMLQEDTCHDFPRHLSGTGQPAVTQIVIWPFSSCQIPPCIHTTINTGTKKEGNNYHLPFLAV